MTSASSILQLNRKAVNLLREGHFQESVLVLDEAIGYLRSALQNGNNELSLLNNNLASVVATATCNDADSWSFDGSHSEVAAASVSESSDVDYVCPLKGSSRRRYPLQEDASRTHGSSTKSMIRSVSLSSGAAKSYYGSADNIFEFFPKLVVFNRETITADVPMNQTMMACVLFNMGVAYHSEGIHRQQEDRGGSKASCDHNLAYALNLYNMAQCYLHQAWYIPHDENTLTLLALALSNNSGHIHAHQLNFRETQYSLDAVLHFMDSLKDSREVGLLRQDYVFFFRTSAIFDDLRLAIAPAA